MTGDGDMENRRAMHISMVVSCPEAPELVGLIVHPELDGVFIGALPDTPAEKLGPQRIAELTGMRLAHDDEMPESRYVLPGLPGGPKVANGDAQGRAWRALQ